MHPLIVKHMLLPIHEFVLRRPSLSYLRAIERSQWWPTDRLKEMQTLKLRRLLSHAVRTSPFYRDRIESAGLDPNGATLNDLRRLPTLSKDDIRVHSDDMIDRRESGNLFPYTTGGSTGAPLAFKIDRSRQAADQAARARTRRWFGIDLGMRELYLWGAAVELAAQDRIKFLRDRLTNHLLLSAFNMTPSRMTEYLHRIRRFDPIHIFGYPSSIARLVRHANETGDRVGGPSLKALFTTGELFVPEDRVIIEEAVSVPVVDGYGSREAGFIAHQCPDGAYHVTMESMIVELLDAEGKPVSSGEPGEIAVTHLDAFGMPFIRYRTGDMAREDARVCSCGRGLTSLSHIEGRKTDMLRTTEGGYAHALSVIYVFRAEPSIRQFKAVQRADLGLDVSIIATDAFDVERQEAVRRQLRRRIGQSIDVRLNLVDEIPPDPSGKHRHVVSQIC